MKLIVRYRDLNDCLTCDEYEFTSVKELDVVGSVLTFNPEDENNKNFHIYFRDASTLEDFVQELSDKGVMVFDDRHRENVIQDWVFIPNKQHVLDIMDIVLKGDKLPWAQKYARYSVEIKKKTSAKDIVNLDFALLLELRNNSEKYAKQYEELAKEARKAEEIYDRVPQAYAKARNEYYERNEQRPFGFSDYTPQPMKADIEQELFYKEGVKYLSRETVENILNVFD